MRIFLSRRKQPLVFTIPQKNKHALLQHPLANLSADWITNVNPRKRKPNGKSDSAKMLQAKRAAKTLVIRQDLLRPVTLRFRS